MAARGAMDCGAGVRVAGAAARFSSDDMTDINPLVQVRFF
jgi:hypothetical protein